MRSDVLIVDDREKLCTSLLTSFRERGYTGVYALDREQALSTLFSRQIDVVVLDIKLGEDNGLDVLTDIMKLGRGIPVIVITGHATVDIAVEALKLGAVDFIEKPVRFTKLLHSFKHALSTRQGNGVPRPVGERTTRNQFVTTDPAMVRTLMEASELAQSELPILICGESGTGKELVADFIHSCSRRSDRSIVKINCASFPETLLDNELFGHEKGAFTGATDCYRGVFERADGGTLFLDELGDMPKFLQPKVLRVVQDQVFRRLGGSNDLEVDVRFVAATNRDLSDLVRAKVFREDLYYRLNAAQITLPPLRERAGDIPLLVRHFLEQNNSASGDESAMDNEVLEIFHTHSWPGNVRELKNAVRYACALSRGQRITVNMLPPYLRHRSQANTNALPAVAMQAGERQIIENTLKQVHYNKTRAAELLNISRVTLYKKIRQYNITVVT